MRLARMLVFGGLLAAGLVPLATPAAHAQSTPPGATRYLVPQSVAGGKVRFLGASTGPAGTQYSYGTQALPAATLQASRTGLWYIVAIRSFLSGRSVVAALAAQRRPGWHSALTQSRLSQTFWATNGRMCLAVSGTDSRRAAIIVVVGARANHLPHAAPSPPCTHVRAGCWIISISSPAPYLISD